MNIKELVFNAVGDKLREAKIKQIIMSFNVENGNVDVVCSDSNDCEMELEPFSKNEISLVRAMYLKKVEKQITKMFPEKTLLSIMAEINVNDETFFIYAEFPNEPIVKIEP